MLTPNKDICTGALRHSTREGDNTMQSIPLFPSCYRDVLWNHEAGNSCSCQHTGVCVGKMGFEVGVKELKLQFQIYLDDKYSKY